MENAENNETNELALVKFMSEKGYQASFIETKKEDEIEKIKIKFLAAGYEVFPHDFYTNNSDGSKNYKINVRKKK
jgi:hypothetical protein